MTPSPDPAALADTDVAVVGGGPAGLLLAAELRLGGARVTVLDERDGPTTESRATTLHARTMEILDARGLLDDLGTPPNEPRGHFGGLPLDLSLPGPHPGQWKVPQGRTEQLLQDRAAALGADLRRHHRVTAVHPGPDGVRVDAETPGGPATVTARWLVACDGEDSTVRRLTAPDFPGRDAEHELLRADVTGLDIPDRRFQRLPRGLAIAATRAGLTRVMVHRFGRPVGERDGKAPEFAEIAEVWQSVTGEDVSGGEPHWLNAFGDAHRQLAAYRHGRVLFAGDAAHRQMPSGGQALNLAVQDAFNLGWKLASVVRGDGDRALLDSYHDERHRVGRQVLANIAAQGALLLGGPEIEPFRALLAELLRLEPVRVHLAGVISGTALGYGGAGGHPLLGARLPDTPLHRPDGTAVRSTELLRTGRGLLLPAAEGPDLREAVRPWAGRVDLADATPAADGPLPAREALLVRPDGHVAWAGDRTAGLTEALTRWFGAPAVHH
ncbi:FAD-dependent monooxygenase [Streptomyces sp. TLI_171]|uniref:FAD-dependent monooxygenase n=1 Tax=Streptomyces sp. TLI_171 TaxID=1938859 RepID=UPI000C1884D9|nr:FAD-dependent monooxygenase [Streptomyces sp. TLI_171]RKE19894.1 oxygenase [Streptomyces sp. TLI_171]